MPHFVKYFNNANSVGLPCFLVGSSVELRIIEFKNIYLVFSSVIILSTFNNLLFESSNIIYSYPFHRFVASISFFVNVPVLSEQIILAPPIVSQA